MQIAEIDLTHNQPNKSFRLQVRNKVNHIKEAEDIVGGILKIDWNLINLGYRSTTCLVKWNDCDEPEIAWTNKLMKAE